LENNETEKSEAQYEKEEKRGTGRKKEENEGCDVYVCSALIFIDQKKEK